ncbi:hypothetical protein AABD69_04145 [Edwardsiella piscicida]|uniref:hypothetical protein n=1 Tax=Edwardsiella piscicida TaxID=1263550 RepID=UPI0015E811DB|nr:hypothetical protein [Edwardsiella piscicida]UCQ15470.1 hypothetical protein DCE53_04135 [Edwardsiella piscicida]
MEPAPLFAHDQCSCGSTVSEQPSLALDASLSETLVSQLCGLLSPCILSVGAVAQWRSR